MCSLFCGALLLFCTAAPRYTHSSYQGDSSVSSSMRIRSVAPDAAEQSAEASEQTGKFSRIGEASYYANKFHGRKTASGERYDRNKFTAAHRTLPYGTMVRVTNLKNNRSVTVRINDRGPQKKSRIIDLSAAAAREIGMISDGVVRVGIEIVTE